MNRVSQDFKFLLIVLFIINVNFEISAQTAEEKCAYYPLHVGDWWKYKVSENVEYGYDPEISYYEKIISGDTLMPNDQKYFIIKKNGHRSYERIDTLNLEIIKYYPEYNREDRILSLDFQKDSTILWIDSEDRPWEITYSDSSNLCQREHVMYYLDYLSTEYVFLEKGWGMTQQFYGEGNWVTEGLIEANVGGKLWQTTSIEGTEKPASEYILFQNFPNPFNSTTIIRFELNKTSNVEILIYTSEGRLVDRVNFEDLTVGVKTYRWDGSRYNSGIYFYKIQSDYFSVTGKMLLIK